jgi:hypothetical protein
VIFTQVLYSSFNYTSPSPPPLLLPFSLKVTISYDLEDVSYSLEDSKYFQYLIPVNFFDIYCLRVNQKNNEKNLNMVENMETGIHQD